MDAKWGIISIYHKVGEIYKIFINRDEPHIVVLSHSLFLIAFLPESGCTPENLLAGVFASIFRALFMMSPILWVRENCH